MAGQLIECVPNFSEGRRQDVIDRIVEPFRTTRGCYLLTTGQIQITTGLW